MGCLWSHEPYESYERSEAYSRGQTSRPHARHAPYNYEVRTSRTPSVPTSKVKPLFGEYKCTACGRSWNSRLSWPNSYQFCGRCKKPVYPFNQREVRPSDIAKTKIDNQEHKRELCQMCQQLGHYCGFQKK